MLIANETEIAAVSTYPIDRRGNAVPVLQDIVDDPACCLFDVQRPDISPMKAIGKLLGPEAYGDAHIWGTRYADRHWSMGDKPLIDWSYFWPVGGNAIHFPLGDWSDLDVQKALDHYRVESAPVDTGDIMACSNCLVARENVFCPKVGKEIPPVAWDREQNLGVFHQILGKKE